MATGMAAMRRVSQAGFWFATGDTHAYRISEVFFGTGKPYTQRCGGQTEYGQCRRMVRGRYCWQHDGDQEVA
jgi:hypothetical protein